MLTFQQFNESLDTPVQVVIGPAVQAQVKAVFRFDGLVYLMDFYMDHKEEKVFFGAPDVPGDRYWSCDFRPSTETMRSFKKPYGWEYGVLGSGNEFKLFAGAVQTFKQFVAKYHPDCVTFSGEEESRKRLYRRFVKSVKSVLPGYEGTEIDNGVFAIYKK